MAVRLGLVALLVSVLVSLAVPAGAASPVRCHEACATAGHDDGAAVPCITDPACAGSAAGAAALAGFLAVLVVAATGPTPPLLGLVPAGPPAAVGRVERRRLLRPPQP